MILKTEHNTQKEIIVKYIEDFGSITPAEAFIELGITKLATRVSELSASGVNFKKELVESKNRYGKRTQFMRYSFAEGEK